MNTNLGANRNFYHAATNPSTSTSPIHPRLSGSPLGGSPRMSNSPRRSSSPSRLSGSPS